MNDPMIFPPALLPIVEQKLRERLLSYVQPGVPRCLLAFVGDGEIEVKRQFTTDHDWRIWHTDLEDGLIGEALRTGQIVEWDEKRPNTPFLKGDPRTIYEIAASISFKDKATAVLLIDYFKEDPADRAHHWKIQGWRGEIAEILATPEREETEIRNHILNAVQVSVDQTKSIRGYIALKQWDGTIRYFTAGQGRDKFRYLSQLEGICGEVMRTGVFQNVGNVWNHPQYRSSDDSIQSEAVAPIKVRGDECIGVLNLESAEANHYTPEREAAILRSADEIIDLADRFRRPVGVDIGAHSLLLSDLVEQFSAPEDNTRLPNEERIWEWAEELCRRKITSLEGVIDATFVDVSVGAEDGRRMRFRPAEVQTTKDNGKDKDAEKEKEQDKRRPRLEDGVWKCDFDLLADSIPRSRVEVRFSDHPKRTTTEIIEQFCRLTSNEVRRRGVELRGAEFERFVAEIRRVSLGDDTARECLLASLPAMLQRMMHCDHVTYFKVGGKTPEGLAILRPWQSTSPKLTYNSDEHFYRACPDDGPTGLAATMTDVLLLRNMNRAELQGLNPHLPDPNRSEKIAEEEAAKLRSLFALPVFKGETLVGLFRGHRTVRRINVSFTEADRDRLRLVQFLLRGVLSNGNGRVVDRSMRSDASLSANC